MQTLDAHTTSLLALVSSFAAAAGLQLTNRVVRNDPGVRWWTSGITVSGIGYILLGLRGVIPDFISIVIANPLFALGYAHLYLGFRRHYGLPLGRRWDIYAASLTAILFFVFTYALPSLSSKIVSISLILAALGFASAWFLLASKPARAAPDRLVPVFLGIASVIVATYMLVRAVLTPFTPLPEDYMKATAIIHTLLPMLFATGMNICLSIGLPLLVTARMQRNLGSSEGRLRATFEQVAVGMSILSEDGRWLAANRKVCEVLGYSSDELLSKNFAELTHPGHLTSDAARIESFLSGKQRSDSWESRCLRKNGDAIWVRLTVAMAQGEDGSSRYFVAVTEDITQAKANAAELAAHRHHLQYLVEEKTQHLIDANAQLAQARDAAEAANRAKSAFLANMSHEIRTPLNAVIGMAHLLRRDQSITPKQTERLARIDVAANHLLEIISDILDMAQIEAGRMSLAKVPVDPNKLLPEVAEMLADTARAKGVRILLDAQALPVHLIGDHTRLRQALLNFAGNAIKFTEAGSITLHARLLDEESSAKGYATIRFEVRDTGVGIQEQVLPNLFARFEQADNSLTRKYGGTGLGLVITKRLAELMGGTVGVESEFGQGSCFWFTARLEKGTAPLPDTSARVTITQAEERLFSDFPGARVLLAEDDLINREVMLELLGESGLVVDCAVNGVEAVDLATRNEYDLILMDVQMPRMDGFEATRRIRQRAERRRIPIIAITADAFDRDRELCLAAGMDDFITKPVDPVLLSSAMLKWLERCVA